MGKLKGLAAGAAGGFAGAALMGPVHLMAAKMIQRQSSQGEDATEKVANAVVKKATGRELERTKKKKGGQIVHYAFGVSIGVLYGLLASTFPAVTTGAGTFLGTAVYVGAHALTVPMLGLAPSPIKNDPAQEGVEFAAHLVYGLVTEGVRSVLS